MVRSGQSNEESSSERRHTSDVEEGCHHSPVLLSEEMLDEDIVSETEAVCTSDESIERRVDDALVNTTAVILRFIGSATLQCRNCMRTETLPASLKKLQTNSRNCTTARLQSLSIG